MTVDTGKGVAGNPATPTSPRQSTGLLARRRGRIGLWFVMPWVVGFLLWYAIPMVASLWFSFTDFNLVSNEPTQYIGLDNWQRLFTDPAVRQSAWHGASAVQRMSGAARSSRTAMIADERVP